MEALATIHATIKPKPEGGTDSREDASSAVIELQPKGRAAYFRIRSIFESKSYNS
jgi:hypothetical protein